MRLQQPKGNEGILSKSFREKTLLMTLGVTPGSPQGHQEGCVNAVVAFLCLLVEVGKGCCVCLFLAQLTESSQMLSVNVGSRELKCLRAEVVSLLRTGCLNSSAHTSCDQITRQQCMLYILHLSCYQHQGHVFVFISFYFILFLTAD